MMNEESMVCNGPFGGAGIEYPINFDLRIIYSLETAPAMDRDLESALARAGVPFSLLQGMAKPGAKYGRMGARVTVASGDMMKNLYSEVAKIPGVKAVI